MYKNYLGSTVLYSCKVSTQQSKFHTGSGMFYSTSSVNLNPAFREPEWQALQTAALQCLYDALQDLKPAGSSTGQEASTVWKVWKYSLNSYLLMIAAINVLSSKQTS